jgi:hypothetical protein
MVNRMQLLQSFLRNVGVDLCRRNIAVTQQQLHDPQVGTVVEQMRREGMSQAVG